MKAVHTQAPHRDSALPASAEGSCQTALDTPQQRDALKAPPLSAELARELDTIRHHSTELEGGAHSIELAIPDIRCAGCIAKIEGALMNSPGVQSARVNLTNKRVRISWTGTPDEAGQPPALLQILERTGFTARVPETNGDDSHNVELQQHLRALAVSGFATGNVMMLSFGVWFGADESTRHLFHWVSAAIAIPALLYSSRVFFSSAWRALRSGGTNMDVPICVGIVITTLLSLYDTLHTGEQVYFDAAIMLVFLLLIGRTLETRMRAKAQSAAGALGQFQPAFAQQLIDDQGTTQRVPVEQLRRGDRLIIEVNERVPVDCKLVEGLSSLDASMLSGESAPVVVSQGDTLYAGSMNLEGALRVDVLNPVEESFLATMERQVARANEEKGRYQELADRVVRYYSPLVHLAALCAFVLWIALGADAHRAITVGVAVLIITCPCALGLAVPIARVIAGQQLAAGGVLIRNGVALERLAQVTSVVFDKTGTLTTGKPTLNPDLSQFDNRSLTIAAQLCQGSDHPYARCIANHAVAGSEPTPVVEALQERQEIIGEGIQASAHGIDYRLGQPGWALEDAGESLSPAQRESAVSVLSGNGQLLAVFCFQDELANGARSCTDALQGMQMSVEILSGDSAGAVRHTAEALGIEHYRASTRPGEKLEHIQLGEDQQRTVLMVGDGINDSAALAAASVSMVPGTGADMTRKMADFVLINGNLNAIPAAIHLARRTRQVTQQNIAFAIAYNLVALPLAIGGLVTPLIAAVAMSLSSVLVIANSLRLARKVAPRHPPLAARTLPASNCAGEALA